MNKTLETIDNLRSIHGNFADREIVESNMDLIINASLKAATGGCLQSYSIIDIDDKELMEKICGYRGSRTLVFLADVNRHNSCGEYLGKKFPAPGFSYFMMAVSDAILAAQNAVVAARSLGIDSLVNTGIHRADQEELFRLLNLPEKNCFPLISVVFGYTDEEPSFTKGRLNGPAIVHKNRYALPNEQLIKKIIHEYDDPQKHLSLSDTWKEKYNHYLEYVYSEWFTEAVDDEEEQLQKYFQRSGFVGKE